MLRFVQHGKTPHMQLRINLIHKFITFLLLAAVLPLLIVGISAYQVSRTIVHEEAIRFTQTLVDTQRDYLDLQSQQIASLIANLLSVEEITNALASNVQTDSYTSLATQARIGYILDGYSNLKGLVSIDIFTLHGAHYHVGDTLDVSRLRTDIVEQLLLQARTSSPDVVWAGIEDNINANSSQQHVITAARMVLKTDRGSATSEPVGVLLVNSSADELRTHFDGVNLGARVSLLIMDAQGRAMYHPDPRMLGTTINRTIRDTLQGPRGTVTMVIDGETMLLTYSTSSLSGWTVLSVVPVATLDARSATIELTVFLALAVACLIVGITSIFASKMIVIPLRNLTRHLQLLQASGPGWEAPLPVRGSDEVAELSRWFNTFLETLSARSRAEEGLRESEERYALALQGANDGIWDWDLRTNHVHYSARWQAILGYANATVATSIDAWLDRVHPDDVALVRQQLDAHLHGTTDLFESEHRIQRHDDQACFWVLARGMTITDAQQRPIRIAGSLTDISTRKQAEDALRESEEQNRLLVEAAPDGVVLFDEGGRVVQMNRAFELLTGYATAQLTGQTLDTLGLVSPEQALYLSASIIKSLQGANRLAAAEFRLTDAQGIIRVLGVRAFGLTIHGDRHYLSTMRDITSEKQVEETLRQANAELARAARTKDEFLANMSHELRTPLNAILALSEMLQEPFSGPLNDGQLTSLHHIEDSGRHLLTLINDILDLSKVEAGRLDLQIEPLMVTDVCESSLIFVKEIASKKAIKLGFALNDQMAEMMGDSKRLKQILVNLLSNAVKFTPNKGRVNLNVTADAEAGTISFAVQDTGIGIALENLTQIFQPFKQLDSSLNRHHEGTGLGLALVRRMVELHGGSVTVESTLGQGSCFTVALPYHPPQALEAPLPEAAWSTQPIGANEGCAALVIEDAANAADQLTRHLQEANVRVIVHPQGDDALAQAVRLKPHLILLNLLMLAQADWELLRQLKATPGTQTIPVIVVSVVDERAKGTAAGAAAYLVQPVSQEMLRQALEAVVVVPEPVCQVVKPAPVALPAPSGGRILLAEDNEVNIMAIKNYLLHNGYEVVVAHNGREALERANELPPDVILMDIQMPEMDGLEAMRRLRALPDYAMTPIIALTALAMPGDRERCLAAGASEYMTKPVSLKGLLALIQRLQSLVAH